MQMENKVTGEKDSKNALRGFTKCATTLKALEHGVLREMVLSKSSEKVEIKRPEIKRKLGMIWTKEQVKRYRPVSFKRCSRGEGVVEVKVPFGYVSID